MAASFAPRGLSSIELMAMRGDVNVDMIVVLGERDDVPDVLRGFFDRSKRLQIRLRSRSDAFQLILP